jgi:F-type H+-transporting ATPase subunit gamma
MQMVAAAKLRRAPEAAEAARPYADAHDRRHQQHGFGRGGFPRRAAASGRHRVKDKVHLLVVMTSERGLCGGFNTTIVRLARAKAQRASGRWQDGQDPHRRQEGPRAAQA